MEPISNPFLSPGSPSQPRKTSDVSNPFLVDNSEEGFRKWYAYYADKYNLDPNPDDPLHFYDYRAAYAAGLGPGPDGHWPSQFKREGHPNTYPGGGIFNSITNTPRPIPGGMPTAQVPVPEGGILGDTAQGVLSSLQEHVPATIRSVSQGLNSALGSIVGGGGKLAADVLQPFAPGPAYAIEQLSQEAAQPMVEAGQGRFESPENVQKDLARRSKSTLEQLREAPVETVAGAAAGMLPFITAPELAPATMAAMGRQGGEEAALAGGASPEAAQAAGQSQAIVDLLAGAYIPERLNAALKGEMGKATQTLTQKALHQIGVPVTGGAQEVAHQVIQKITTGEPMKPEEAAGATALMAILHVGGTALGAAPDLRGLDVKDLRPMDLGDAWSAMNERPGNRAGQRAAMDELNRSLADELSAIDQSHEAQRRNALETVVSDATAGARSVEAKERLADQGAMFPTLPTRSLAPTAPPTAAGEEAARVRQERINFPTVPERMTTTARQVGERIAQEMAPIDEEHARQRSDAYRRYGERLFDVSAPVAQPAVQRGVMPKEGPRPESTLGVAQGGASTEAPPITAEEPAGETIMAAAGIPLGDISKRGPLPEKTQPIRSAINEVEQAWRQSNGLKSPTVLQKLKQSVIEGWRSMRRSYKHINPRESPEMARVQDILRRFDAAKAASQRQAFDEVDANTKDLTPNQGDLFSRNLAVPDIIREFESGRYADKEQMGYLTADEAKADLERFREALARPENKAVRDALARREEMRQRVTQELVKRGLLTEEAAANPDYFHRQVLEYYNEGKSGGGGRGIRPTAKGFQKERTGGGNFNTNYQQAEFAWLSDAYELIAKHDALMELRDNSDISTRLKQEQKDATGSEKGWTGLIPKGYKAWKPGGKNSVKRPAEQAIDRILGKEAEDLEADDITEDPTGIGGTWAIPDNLAKTLNEQHGNRSDAALEKIWTGAQSTWKQWTLLNPGKALKYNLNNMSGDLDIVVASNPGILRHAKQAAGALWRYHMGRNATAAETAKIHRLQKLGVLDSGLTVEEIPDINKEGALRTLTETQPGKISRGVQLYWNKMKGFTSWRENTLRMAAYDYFLDAWAKGKKEYGASNKSEVNAIKNPEQRAAKIARELVGDYGNVSEGGKWLRRHLIPFYSWLEINAPRYYRLLKNSATSDESAGVKTARAAAVAGKKIATKTLSTVVKANILFGATAAWNQLVFPEEDKELGEARREPHIILGRDKETGEIRWARFAGALGDALDWFSLQDWPTDVKEIVEGKKTLKAQAAEMVKAPVDKLASALEPVTKTIYETLTGRSMYPRVSEKGEGFKLSPRVIYDRPGQIAKTLSLGVPYEYVTHKPSRGFSLSKLLINKTDPGEAAYWSVRSNVNKWLQDQGKDTPAGFDKSDKLLALYYHKKSLQYKDKKNAEYWLKKYYDLGGTDEGIDKSIEKSAPLGGLSKKDYDDFVDTLSKEQQLELRRAELWYDKRMY